MNILLTNDDGYGAWGIEALIEALEPEHKLYVIAPDGNRSGKGMAICVNDKLEYRKMAENRYTCSGNPADCIMAGMRAITFDEPIDLVISGINHGPNLGTDILYSGTCGAASEATLYGLPAIAVSLSLTGHKDWNSRESWDFRPLAKFVADNLESLMSLARPSIEGATVGDKPGVFVNVNAFDFPEFSGVRMTNPCFMKHDATAKLTLNGVDNSRFSSVFYGISFEPARKEDSDYAACDEGYVSVSLVLAEPVGEYKDLDRIDWVM